jgi:hypothetical protein
MTQARTKVRATVKTDSAHFLTVDLGCQFAWFSRKIALNESRQTASLPYPRAAIFIVSDHFAAAAAARPAPKTVFQSLLMFTTVKPYFFAALSDALSFSP